MTSEDEKLKQALRELQQARRDFIDRTGDADITHAYKQDENVRMCATEALTLALPHLEGISKSPKISALLERYHQHIDKEDVASIGTYGPLRGDKLGGLAKAVFLVNPEKPTGKIVRYFQKAFVSAVYNYMRDTYGHTPDKLRVSTAQSHPHQAFEILSPQVIRNFADEHDFISIRDMKGLFAAAHTLPEEERAIALPALYALAQSGNIGDVEALMNHPPVGTPEQLEDIILKLKAAYTRLSPDDWAGDAEEFHNAIRDQWNNPKGAAEAAYVFLERQGLNARELARLFPDYPVRRITAARKEHKIPRPIAESLGLDMMLPEETLMNHNRRAVRDNGQPADGFADKINKKPHIDTHTQNGFAR